VVEVHGVCDPRFEAVREAFAANFDRGLDSGASVAVTLRGEYVVDLWAGVANDDGTHPWERDTIVNVYSTTKTMTALCALVLADRGELDFCAPVIHYWPEFGACGKERIEVRHLMSHTAGLPGWDTEITTEDLYDWDKVTSLLARQAPWWEPGTASGYHALTQGNLVGEVVRRVSGLSPGQFFAAEIAGPLGADFHIGLDPEHDPRVADLIPPEEVGGALAADPSTIAGRVFRWPRMNALDSRTRGWRGAEIPAGNGHGNARSIARIHTVLVNGGEAWGKRLLSPAGCESIFEEQINGVDLVLGTPLRHGIGFGLNSPEAPLGPNPRTCYWGGWGGSLALLDFDARLVIGFAMTRMNSTTQGDSRTIDIGQAVYRSLGATS
jgi:CubicO group peptidase (beta-lactamase class C family)